MKRGRKPNTELLPPRPPGLKVTDAELYAAMRAGMSQADIAREYGMSREGVRRRVDKLQLEVAATIHNSPGRLMKRELNTADQLQKINAAANKILDENMQAHENNTAALVEIGRIALESKDEDDRKLAIDKLVSIASTADPRKEALRAMREIRNQLQLQIEIYQMLYDVKAVQRFQGEVLNAIGKVDPALRAEIIMAIKQASALHDVLGG